MSLWLDFPGTQVRYVETPTYGRIRIAEAGQGNQEVILFQHGLKDKTRDGETRHGARS